MSIVWLDGELVDKADAKIGVADHGLLFGDRISVDMRAYNGRVFGLRQHLEWLVGEAAEHAIMLPVVGDALATAIHDTLKANHRTDGFVKVVVTRGAGPLTLDPRKCVPTTIIFAEEAAPFPYDLYTCGLDVVSFSGGHNRPKAKSDALTQGCLESLILSNPGNIVLGGSETNVGWVSGEQTWVIPTHDATSDAVAKLAGAGRRNPTHAELCAAEEVFLVSAAAEIIAVRSIDRQPIANGNEGPVTRRLREAFAAMVRTGNWV